MSAVEAALQEATVDARDRKIARLERDRDDALRTAKALARELEIAEERAQVALAITEPREPTPIRPRSKSERTWEAAAVMMASDWHVGETVDPRTINGLNKYDPAICEARAHSLFKGWAWTINLLATGDVRYRIDQAVLWLGGDIINGYIHEEFVESNSMSPTEEIIFAQDLIAAGIEYLLKSTPIRRLVVPCNFGNHGRTTIKTRVSTAAKNSLEWLMYHQLARRFAKDSRVEFHVAGGDQVCVEVMGRTLRGTHGDKAKFAGGVGGIAVPLRKAVNGWNLSRRAEVTLLGHFHQHIDGGDFVVNGSLIGFNAFAQDVIKAPCAPPSQGFFVLDKDRGKRCVSPIMVDG